MKNNLVDKNRFKSMGIRVNLTPIDGPQMECPVCTKSGSSLLRHAYDDRYGQPDRFSLVACKNCGHIMTMPRLCDSDLAGLYSTYYPRKQVNVEDLKREVGRSSISLANLRRWWGGTNNQGQYAVKPGELMLDIGCGSCLSLLEARAMGAEVRGIDADPNVKRIADDLGLSIHIGSLIDEPFSDMKFDLIVLNQVLEHVPDPSLMLVRLRSRLKSEGRIILVFPNVDSFWRKLFRNSWINWHIPYHLHHFSYKSFKRMTERLGYQVRSVRTITPNLWTILQIRSSLIRVNRGDPSPIWAVSASSSGEQGDAELIKFRLSHIFRELARLALKFGLILPIPLLNRLVDMTGYGDSVMVEIVSEEIS